MEMDAGQVLVAKGWRYVLGLEGFVTCPTSETLEFFRDGWDAPVQTKYNHFHPEFNIAGLFWRPIPPEPY